MSPQGKTIGWEEEEAEGIVILRDAAPASETLTSFSIPATEVDTEGERRRQGLRIKAK